MKQLVHYESGVMSIGGGGSPVVGSAYTLTFGTVSRTLPATTATAVDTTAPVVVPATSVAGFSASQATALIAAVNALITDLDGTKKVVKQVVADLQALGVLL